MSNFSGRTVLITGAASGIGLLMGKLSLKRGAKRLVMWDIDQDALQATGDELLNAGYEVTTQVVDVRSIDQIEQAHSELLNSHIHVDILINNAGVIVGKAFAKHTIADINKTMEVNALALMYVTHTFLPDMQDRNSGHIVNIASAAGLTPNPGMTVYAASKWAAVGWSDSLRIELEKTHPRIKVLTVMPSYINTGMFEGVTPPLFVPLLDPEKISVKILDAIEKDKIQLKAPFMVKTSLIFRGLLPQRAFDFIAGNIFKVYSSMDNFKGRNHS